MIEDPGFRLCVLARLHREAGRLDEAWEAYREALQGKVDAAGILSEAEGGLSDETLPPAMAEAALTAFDGRGEELEDEAEALADAWRERVDGLESICRTAGARDREEPRNEPCDAPHNDPNKEARCLCLQARIYRKLGRIGDVCSRYGRALLRTSTEAWVLGEAEQGLSELALLRGSRGVGDFETLITRFRETAEDRSIPWRGAIDAVESSGFEPASVAETLRTLGDGDDAGALLDCLAVRAYRRENRLAEAESTCRRALALEIDETGLRRELELSLAEVLLARGKPEVALTTFEAVIEGSIEVGLEGAGEPGAFARGTMGRIDSLMALDRFEDAVEACETALQRMEGRPGDAIRFLDRLAEIYRERQQYEEAGETYRRLLDLVSSDGGAPSRTETGPIDVAERTGGVPGVFNPVRRRSDRWPSGVDERVRVLFAWADMLRDAGRLEDALSPYLEILRTWGGEASVLDGEVPVVLEKRTARPEGVKKAMRSVGFIFVEMGFRALRGGSWDRALRLFREAGALLTAADDGTTDLARHRVVSLTMMGRCSEAEGGAEDDRSRAAELEGLLRDAGADGEFFRELGDLFLGHGEYGLALDPLRTGLKLAVSSGGGVSTFEATWRSLVRWYREQNLMDEAIAFVDDELTLHPGEAGLLFHRGECLMEKGDPEGAIRSFRETIAVRSTMNWVHFSLGKCLYEIGDFAGAVEAFDRNLAVCEDELSHFHAWIFKAMALERLGDRDGARRCLARARGYEPFAGTAEIPEERAFLEAWDTGEPREQGDG